MTPQRILYTLLPTLLLLATRVSAQQLDSMTAGRTYVVAFPDTTQNLLDERFRSEQVDDTIALYLYSPTTTSAQITGSGYSTTVTVQGGTFTEIDLNDVAENLIVDRSNEVSPNVFRIEAVEPIIVYAYLATKFGCEAWTPLPVERWGREYIASTLQGEPIVDVTPAGETEYKVQTKAAAAEITVIAAYDSTEVRIIPPDAGVLLEGAPTLTVTLNANQAYQVQGVVDTLTEDIGKPQIELTGVRIVASRPISVMSGNTRNAINANNLQGIARNSLKNMAMECLSPVEQYGKEFIFTPPMDDRQIADPPSGNVSELREADLLHITTGSNDGDATVERFGDSTGVPETFLLAPGASHSDSLTGASIRRARVYRASAPSEAFAHPFAAVKALGVEEGSASYDSWGSYMVEMTPREQWSTFAPFIAPPHLATMRHYVNIVTDTASRSSIVDELGGTITNWTTIPGTNVCWASRAVAPGTHWFRATTPNVRFGAFAYGFMKGHEELHPARTVRKGDGRDVAHPLEFIIYRENLALTYAYPVAPRRASLQAPSSVAWSDAVAGSVTISPMPARDRAELQFHLQQPGHIEVALLDATGREMLRVQRLFGVGEATLPIDVDALASGVYYCRINIDGAVQTLPLIVAR